jgi:hypothetical protein
MAGALRPRLSWVLCIAGIIGMGILSRMVHTGWVVLDKYLGDALYAAMVYGVLRLFLRSAAAAGAWAGVAMIAIECFQLTGMAAGMLESEVLAVRICARLLGTHFSWLDLAAYGVGIGCMGAVDWWRWGVYCERSGVGGDQ